MNFWTGFSVQFFSLSLLYLCMITACYAKYNWDLLKLRLVWRGGQHGSLRVAVFHFGVYIQVFMLHRPEKQDMHLFEIFWKRHPLFYLELVLHLARQSSNWSETLKSNKLLNALASFNTDMSSSFCKDISQISHFLINSEKVLITHIDWIHTTRNAKLESFATPSRVGTPITTVFEARRWISITTPIAGDIRSVTNVALIIGDPQFALDWVPACADFLGDFFSAIIEFF